VWKILPSDLPLRLPARTGKLVKVGARLEMDNTTQLLNLGFREDNRVEVKEEAKQPTAKEKYMSQTLLVTLGELELYGVVAVDERFRGRYVRVTRQELEEMKANVLKVTSEDAS
jgi:hypothetical protein